MDNLLAAMVSSRRDIASDIGLRAHPCEETDMPFYEKGDVRIRYEEAGSGFTLLLIPGGGLNSTISFFTGHAPSTQSRSSRTSTAVSRQTCATPTAASPPARSRSTGPGTHTPTTSSA